MGNVARELFLLFAEFFLDRNRYRNMSPWQDTHNFVQSTFSVSLRLSRSTFRLPFFRITFLPSVWELRNCTSDSYFLSCPRNVRGCNEDVGVERALIKLWCHHISRHCWVTGLGTRPSLWFYKYLRTFTTWDEQDRYEIKKNSKNWLEPREVDREGDREWERKGRGGEREKEKAYLSSVVRSSACIPLDRKAVVY